MSHRNRAAFTRVEALVMVVIAGILSGIFCSAIVRNRESAGREQCKNNLRQICLAALEYESVHGDFPPGLVGAPSNESPNNLNFPNHGPLPFLLPYLSAYSLFYKEYDQYTGGPPVAGGMVFINDPGFPDYWPSDGAKQTGHPSAPWWNNATNVRLAQARITSFLCPSDDAYANTQFTSVCTVAGQNEFVNIVVPVNAGGADLGRTNYIGNAGTIGWTKVEFYQQYVGPFFSRSKVKIAKMADGLSNTILFGETLGGESHGERTRSLSWMGAGAMPTAFGLPQKSYSWNFSSKHRDVVQFGMADGAVLRCRRLDVDGQTPSYFSRSWYTFQRLGGYRDNERIDYTLVEY